MLDYATLTDIGSRSLNEDRIGAAQKGDRYCFVVCDGLGGHGMGDIASRLVTDVFLETFQKATSCDTILSTAFSTAQSRLLARQREDKVRHKMRTTAAVLLVDGKTVHIGHVGDSRVYIFGENGTQKRTLDHSVPQMLALSGEITDEQIRKHPDRNVLLRAMGTDWERPMYELMPPFPLSACRAFLLCSDGFWEYISDREMRALLDRSRTAEEWLNAMRAVVAKNGMHEKADNYSAIAVFVPKGNRK